MKQRIRRNLPRAFLSPAFMLRNLLYGAVLLAAALLQAFMPPADTDIMPQEGGSRLDAANIAASLDDARLAGQVIITGIDGSGTLQKESGEILTEIAPGGVMLFKYNIKGDVNEIKSFTSGIRSASGDIPPFIAIDHEGGRVNRFGSLLSRLPAPGFYGEVARTEGAGAAAERVYGDAFRAGTELRSLGINLNFAPVVEILTPENAPFLEDRSYGSEGEFTASCALAFSQAMRAAAVAPVLKHFPGSGSDDPHAKAPVINYPREILEVQTLPFKKIIGSGAPAAVMLSHSIVPAIDPHRNASLSPAVIRWLREDIGFEGIILGDDYSMGAITESGQSPEDAVIEALRAGVDAVMAWPSNLRSIHAGILRELKQNPAFRGRLEEAASRLIYEKIRLGLLR